jgi:hypothetical protein
VLLPTASVLVIQGENPVNVGYYELTCAQCHEPRRLCEVKCPRYTRERNNEGGKSSARGRVTTATGQQKPEHVKGCVYAS